MPEKTSYKLGIHSLPEEILALIVRACVPRYRVCICNAWTASDTSQSFSKTISVTYTPSTDHLNDLKLVNKAFYDLTRNFITQNFTGRLDIKNLTDSDNEDPRVFRRTNALLSGQLSYLAPRVRAIDVTIYYLQNLLDHLDLDLLPGLRSVHYMLPVDLEYHGTTSEDHSIKDALAGKFDKQFVVDNADQFRYYLPFDGDMGALQERNVKLILSACCAVWPGKDVVFCVDVTRPERTTVLKRIIAKDMRAVKEDDFWFESSSHTTGLPL